MKHFVFFALALAASAAQSGPLSEIDLPSSGYDIGAFRKYSEKKSVPTLGNNSLRVFFMGDGRVGNAVEIDLETGNCRIWPDWFDDSKPRNVSMGKRYAAAVAASLEKEDLNAIPKDVRPSFDGGCELLEIRTAEGYFWRLHRNSTNGYFRALTSLASMVLFVGETKGAPFSPPTKAQE